jgi:hypothetical protein
MILGKFRFEFLPSKAKLESAIISAVGQSMSSC